MMILAVPLPVPEITMLDKNFLLNHDGVNYDFEIRTLISKLD